MIPGPHCAFPVRHPGAWAQQPSYSFPSQRNLPAPSLLRPQRCSQLMIVLLITEKNRSNQKKNYFSHHPLYPSTSVSTRTFAFPVLKATAPLGPGFPQLRPASRASLLQFPIAPTLHRQTSLSWIPPLSLQRHLPSLTVRSPIFPSGHHLIFEPVYSKLHKTGVSTRSASPPPALS